MNHRGLERPILLHGGGRKVNFPVCMAPMVGLSHVSFRRMLRGYLPSGAETIWPTEMLNSRRLPYERLGETPETLRGEEESHLVPQILGNEEGFIASSVLRLEKEWGASGIDINMGCPVDKALRHNYGVSLMGDAEYASEVVRMTVRSTGLPVSVKLRAGFQDDSEFLVKFVKGLEAAGASWLTLHPRLASEGRRGFARWDQIGLIRGKLDVPVIGNGDIQVAEDVFSMFKQTGCDMVMVGRALTARPWLLWQVGEVLGFSPPPGRTGPAPRGPEEESREYGAALLKLLEFLADPRLSQKAVRQFKFYVRTSSIWLDFGNRLMGDVSMGQTIEELREIVARFFESGSYRLSQRTTLRV